MRRTITLASLELLFTVDCDRCLHTPRPEDTEAQRAESSEFLSAIDDKKNPRFTDVSSLNQLTTTHWVTRILLVSY